MPARARLGTAHALACAGWGAAAALVASHPMPPSSLALGAAVAAAVAAIGVLLPPRGRRGSMNVIAVLVSITAVVACAIASSLVGELRAVLLVAPLAAAAGIHARAMSAAAAADPALAPRVRLAPGLLALAAGAALVAAADASGQPSLVVLVVIALLQLAAFVLLVRAAGATTHAEHDAAPADAAPPARLLPLLALAVAGTAAVVALRPALSALGADEPQPAGPAALTLAIGGLAGPPLARLVARLGLGRGGALLASLAGAAALAAPIARPGGLDLLSAAVLGVALAAAVALAELARRAGATLLPRAVALLLLAGALGAAVAGLLLTSVPLPDVVLGASIACLVAGLGAWAPAPRERVA